MKDDDDDIQDYVASTGWRKRQVNEVYEKIRNDTIDEVSQEIEKFTAFGQDTIASFSVYIKGMKR